MRHLTDQLFRKYDLTFATMNTKGKPEGGCDRQCFVESPTATRKVGERLGNKKVQGRSC